MKNPLVSVIIPNYSHARYLNKRIGSVLEQTYQNFEIIILDDCSTDNSRDIIESYRTNAHVSHIVYNQNNTGNTFIQWEKGLALANGELCYIAESDDFCRPELLERLVRKFEENYNLVLAKCNTFFVNEDGFIYDGIEPRKKDEVYSGPDFIRKNMLCGNGICNAGMALFSRRFALSVDKTYQSFKGAGDYMFWVEIAECGSVAVVNEPLNFFRRHSGAVTAKRDSDGSNLRDRRKIFDYICLKIKLTEKEKSLGVFSNLMEMERLNFEDNIRCELEQLWKMPKNEYLSFLKEKKSFNSKLKNKFSDIFFKVKKKIYMKVLRMSYHQTAKRLYKF